MNNYDLITTEDYAKLPDDQEQCFVEIEAICRASMTRILDNEESGGDINRAVMTTYMSVISAAALECGVGTLEFEPTNDIWREFGSFSMAVQGMVAKIRIRHRGARNPHSVQLTNRARAAIEIQVGKLRDAIAEAPLDEERKRALDKKLDELLSELKAGTRVSFGKVMAALALATATMAGVTTIAADGPQAIQNILRLIGIEKLTEEEAVRRLTPPPRMLEAPKPVKKTEPLRVVSRGGYSADLDDDIPF